MKFEEIIPHMRDGGIVEATLPDKKVFQYRINEGALEYRIKGRSSGWAKTRIYASALLLADFEIIKEEPAIEYPLNWQGALSAMNEGDLTVARALDDGGERFYRIGGEGHLFFTDIETTKKWLTSMSSFSQLSDFNYRVSS